MQGCRVSIVLTVLCSFPLVAEHVRSCVPRCFRICCRDSAALLALASGMVSLFTLFAVFIACKMEAVEKDHAAAKVSVPLDWDSLTAPRVA